MKRFFTAVTSVAGFTLLSRVLGFARDIIIATLFPVGIHTDAFLAAFRIPNQLRRLTAEGTMNESFVPVYNMVRERQGDAAAARLRDHVAAWLALALALLAVAGVLGAPWLVAAVAPGFSAVPGKAELTTELLRITFPYVALISLAAFGGAVLGSHRRFAAFAFIPALLNLSIIACALWLAPRMANPVEALAWGVLGGGIAQLAWQGVALARHHQFPRPRLPRLTPEVRRALRLGGHGFLGVLIAYTGVVIGLAFASGLPDGSVTWLYFADRLMDLPVALVGTALGTVGLPTLARQVAAGPRAFAATLDWTLRCAWLFALPSAVGLGVLALPLVATFFQHGNFTAADTASTMAATVAYCVGIPALVLAKTLRNGFIAREDALTPVQVSAVALAVTVALYLVFVPWLAHVGVALALSCGATLSAAVLVALLVRRGHLRPAGRAWAGFVARTGAAAVVMGAVLLLARGDAQAWNSAGVAVRIAWLAALVAGGGACYFLVLYASGWRLAHLRQPSAIA